MTTDATIPAAAGGRARPDVPRVRQALAVMRLELRRTLFSLRTAPVYFLALFPVFLAALFALAVLFGIDTDGAEFERGLPVAVSGITSMILHFSTYFACVWLFINLFRGEMIDRSLHFLLLAPVSRPVLVAGKFLGGIVFAVTLFTLSTAATLAVIALPFGAAASSGSLFESGAIGLMGRSLVAVAMACIGYGAVFLTVGLFFKSPIIPALVVWVWESFNQVLPPVLAKISVIHYVESMQRAELAEGAIAIVGEPTPPWISIPGILAVTAVALAVAAWRVKRLEIDYSTD